MGRLDQGPVAGRRSARPGRSARPARPARTARLGLGLSALALTTGLVTVIGAGSAAAGPKTASRVFNLSSPTSGHSYRHGAVPLRVPGTNGGMATTTQGNSSPRGGRPTSGPSQRDGLRFGGGAVVTGSPKVFVVFWGAQWGTESTNGSGYKVYSGDPQGLAPNLQAFFAGIGTNNELWSAVVTQYCQGVAAGAKTCPVSPLSGHVPYPSSTVLGGAWEDTSANLSAASATQIAQEAANAAVHFSNPPNAQYVIVSPTGTDPDGWLDPINGYCAYHDNTQDPALGIVTGPDVPYTNMPYVPDVGGQCSSFANPGVLDGADETASHEYAEVLTDPFPSTGWNDRRGSEIADKCENLAGGSPGGSVYVTLATGTFVLQGLWANDLSKKGGCENAHSAVLVLTPGKQKGSQRLPVSLPISASDVRGQPLTYAASGLPAGLVINATSGVISGTPQARGHSVTTVVVSDASSSASVSFVWTIRR